MGTNNSKVNGGGKSELKDWTHPLLLLLLLTGTDNLSAIEVLKQTKNGIRIRWLLSKRLRDEPKLRDLQVTHHAWEKQNLLSRHNKTFPLQILLRKTKRSKKSLGNISPNSSKKKLNQARKRIKSLQADSKSTDQKSSTDEGDMLSKEPSLRKEATHLGQDELRAALNLGRSWTDNPAGIFKDHFVYVVAGYPENHNHLISRCTQEKIDWMGPREYLDYILTKLSVEERESLLVDEKERRKTYLAHWSLDGNLSAEKMSQAGFYSLGIHDKVQCSFCRGSLQRWDPQDNPMTEHAKAFPFCRFAKGLECGNKEYRNTLLSGDELKNVKVFSSFGTKKNRDGSTSIDCNLLGINTIRAQVLKYALEATRSQTFARWPASSPIDAETLCSAGFYYTGFDDSVRCFYCVGTLKNWQQGDDPWIEHARWFPYCSYLLQLKGKDFVDEIHASTLDGSKYKRTTALEAKQIKELNSKKLLEEEMIETCIKLGHKRSTVQQALQLNGGPYESITLLLAALYKLEENTTPDQEPQAQQQESTKRMAVAEEDREKIVTDSAQYYDATDNLKAPAGCCLNCYSKAHQSVPANHIGLPCGHLLFCETCNTQEVMRSANPGYKSKCPYQSCEGSIASTFKTFVT